VPWEYSLLSLQVQTQHFGATVTFNGVSMARDCVNCGWGALTAPLTEGDTTSIRTVVTAQDGVTSRTYHLFVTRGTNPISQLSSLIFGGVKPVLIPAFSGAITTYKAKSNPTTPLTSPNHVSDSERLA